MEHKTNPGRGVGGMDNEISDEIGEGIADLILIMQSVFEDGDKFWEKDKDWLLDDDGNRVYL